MTLDPANPAGEKLPCATRPGDLAEHRQVPTTTPRRSTSSRPRGPCTPQTGDPRARGRGRRAARRSGCAPADTPGRCVDVGRHRGRARDQPQAAPPRRPASARSDHPAPAADRRRAPRALGLLRRDRGARPAGRGPDRGQPGGHAAVHDLVGTTPGTRRTPKPAHGGRVLDLRCLGGGRDAGDRGGRRGGRGRSDRDGHALRHRRAGGTAVAVPTVGGERLADGESGPEPASTRSARSSPQRARRAPRWSPPRWWSS